ncbi:DUF4240 domain-containing protein [Streptomyces sp. NPDC003691]
MDEKAFWALIDALSRHSGDRAERVGLLHSELLSLPAPADVVEFQAHLEAACAAVETDGLLRALTRIEAGFCSDDGFHYFSLWLVAQGRAIYEAALADPDVLADLPAVQALAGRDIREWDDDEWLEWEELDYVAQGVYEELTGRNDDAFYQTLDAFQQDADEPASAAAGPAPGPATPRLDALFPAPIRG